MIWWEKITPSCTRWQICSMVHPRCDVIVQVRDANLSLEKVWSYAPLHIIYARVHKTNLSTETYYAPLHKCTCKLFWVLLGATGIFHVQIESILCQDESWGILKGRHPVPNNVSSHTSFTGVWIDELCTWRNDRSCQSIGLTEGHVTLHITISSYLGQDLPCRETAPLWRKRERYITGHEERW